MTAVGKRRFLSTLDSSFLSESTGWRREESLSNSDTLCRCVLPDEKGFCGQVGFCQNPLWSSLIAPEALGIALSMHRASSEALRGWRGPVWLCLLLSSLSAAPWSTALSSDPRPAVREVHFLSGEDLLPGSQTPRPHSGCVSTVLSFCRLYSIPGSGFSPLLPLALSACESTSLVATADSS